ncbi:putative F420-dependent oxidoreductase [Micromonospora sp. L5]|uniref:LLM class F420-dependent oxidoreductase n=1 Tax=Micromonospora TaxID=1873 RepID=UPI0001C45C80|nr:LLM class F420-dependent oxidoreductase [Micromonospora sp. L5]ADU06392.1 putative F420-dependent oxidoreductase [Micromonospora sp. L5]
MDVRIVAEPHQGATYADVLRAARAVEDGGFGGFFVADHLMAFGDGDGEPGPVEAWVTLAGLARETDRIRLGTLLSAATFRHPSVLAVQVAQVDRMSGGRVELGLGAGWWADEHRAFGIGLPAPSTRLDRLCEQLEVITRLWSCRIGERVTFTGRHYQLVECRGLPKPQQDRLPVIVGGLGPRRTPALAARYASEFNVPYATAAEMTDQFARLRRACEAIGRDPGELVYSAAVAVACGRTEQEFAARASAGGSTPQRYRERKAGGRPDEVVRRVREYAAAGCERIYLQLPDVHDIDHIRLLADEVLPELRSGSTAPAEV